MKYNRKCTAKPRRSTVIGNCDLRRWKRHFANAFYSDEEFRAYATATERIPTTPLTALYSYYNNNNNIISFDITFFRRRRPRHVDRFSVRIFRIHYTPRVEHMVPVRIVGRVERHETVALKSQILHNIMSLYYTRLSPFRFPRNITCPDVVRRIEDNNIIQVGIHTQV